MMCAVLPTPGLKPELPSPPMGYFEEALWEYHQSNEPCTFLPSLLELAKNLNASILDIQHALASLCKKGYHYYALGLNTPITLSYSPRFYTRSGI